MSNYEFNVTDVMRRIVMGAYLENTRMIFDFMLELSSRWNQEKKAQDRMYTGEGGLERRNEILAGLKGWVKDKINKSDLGNLYQNPLSAYIRFYKELFQFSDKDNSDTIAAHITPMLNYFNILNYLTQETDKDDNDHKMLPYVFEDLCLSIMALTNCDSCSILYHQKGEPIKVISRNGDVGDFNDIIAGINMSVPELDSVIKAYQSQSKKLTYTVSTVGGGTFELSFKESDFFKNKIEGIKSISATAEAKKPVSDDKFEHEYMLFEFPEFATLSEDDEESQRGFFLMLDYKKEQRKNIELVDMLTYVLRVLFLRNRLWDAMENNYSELIQMRYDCSYVKSVLSADEKKEGLGLLHISDVHLVNELKWDVRGGSIVSSLMKSLKRDNGSETLGVPRVDLLAITGDIVQGSTNASDAQEKYSKAGMLLKEIAVELWAKEYNGKKVLPHDWKRRILLVPGNHDYSAMSDVVVETHFRRIKGGFPATKSGGTMSKLTYYIEFLVSFLDAPMDELLENDMNEIRSYDELNLKIALLNSVSKINSLQNNKVAFNEEKLDRLFKSKQWKGDGFKIVMMHHSPEYEIDYFMDKYEPYYYSIGNLYWEYINLLKEWLEDEKVIEKLIGTARNLKKDLIKYSSDDGVLKTQLYTDMNTLIKIYEDTLPKDEFYDDFRNKHKSTNEMQIKDKKEFYGICRNFLPKVDVVLAGHIHSNKYEVTVFKKGDKNLCIDSDCDEINKSTYIANKFYNKGKEETIIAYTLIDKIHTVFNGTDVTNKYDATVYWFDDKGKMKNYQTCPCAKYKSSNKCDSKCM